MNPVCSKAARKLQWPASIMLTVALIAGVGACSRHKPAEAQPGGRKTPSGAPVPRYVALKFGEVNARGGPGDDYKVLWVYHAKRLPLQVVAETSDWRRVCDQDGQMSWVHAREVAERRTVLVIGDEDVILRRGPMETAAAAAILAAHAVADLDQCKVGWCRVKVDRAVGWAPADRLWGLADAPQCHG
jgi:SH3-like domain-containing protein